MDTKKYEETRKYLGHISGKSIERDIEGMNNELKVALDALQGMVTVKVKW